MNRHYGAALGLVYFASPFFLFRQFVSTDPRRTQSVCSLIASLYLSPTGLREALGLTVSVLEQRRAAEIYVVYTAMDMVLALLYYPAQMRWLEGWVHHTASGAFALYCLSTGRSYLVSRSMIVEVSTILLCLPRVFPSTFNTRLVKKYLFPGTFFVCRLVLLPIMAYRSHLGVTEKVLAVAFTYLNARWFVQRVRKEW